MKSAFRRSKRRVSPELQRPLRGPLFPMQAFATRSDRPACPAEIERRAGRADRRLSPAVPRRATADQGAGTRPDPKATMQPLPFGSPSGCHPSPPPGPRHGPPQRSVAGQTERPSSPASSRAPRKPAERQQAGRDPVKAPRSSRPVTAFQRVFRRAGEVAAHATRARRPPRRYGTIQGPHGWPRALRQELSMPKGRTPFPVRFRSGTLTAGRLSRTGTR